MWQAITKQIKAKLIFVLRIIQLLATIILFLCIYKHSPSDFQDLSILAQRNTLNQELNSIEYLDTLNDSIWTGTVQYDQKIRSFQLSIERNLDNASEISFMINLIIKKGEYFDDGQIILSTQRYFLNDMEVLRKNNTQIFQPKDLNECKFSIKGSAKTYNKYRIENEEALEFTHLRLILEVKSDDEIEMRFQLGSQDEGFLFEIIQKKTNECRFLFLTVLLIAICRFQDKGLRHIIQSICQGIISLSSYSLVTFFMATLWDVLFASLIVFLILLQPKLNSMMIVMFSAALNILHPIYLSTKVIIAILKQDYCNEIPKMLLFKCVLLFCLSFPILFAVLYLTNSEDTIILIFSFIFLPQIYKNAVNNSTTAFTPSYILEYLLPRFSIIWYLKQYPFSIYQFRPNSNLVIAVGVILGIQLLLLEAQRVYGPRSFIPQKYLKWVFPYTIILNLEAKKCNDNCPRCALSLNTQPTDEDIQKLGISQNRGYIKTPCGHIFHYICFVKWMAIKMPCPICRKRLPPVR